MITFTFTTMIMTALYWAFLITYTAIFIAIFIIIDIWILKKIDDLTASFKKKKNEKLIGTPKERYELMKNVITKNNKEWVFVTNTFEILNNEDGVEKLNNKKNVCMYLYNIKGDSWKIYEEYNKDLYNVKESKLDFYRVGKIKEATGEDLLYAHNSQWNNVKEGVYCVPREISASEMKAFKIEMIKKYRKNNNIII